MPRSLTTRSNANTYHREPIRRELSSTQERLITDHLELATNQAKRHRRKGVDFADLQQVAYEGLVAAARRFKPEKGDFPAFASVTISGELKKYFRDCAWSVRPPRRVQELKPLLTSDLNNDRLNADRVTELADYHNVNRSDVTDALSAATCYSADSLDAPPPHSDAPRGDTVSDGSDEHARTDLMIDLVRSLQTLQDHDRRLIDMRFVEQLTQQEIAAQLGTSQMQVSRRLSRLMTRLRGKLEPQGNLLPAA